jgi:hypothetical protein
MALKGTLRDFGLSDIFQLIGLQKKTGTLHLEDHGRKVVVSFVEGKVVRAEALSVKTREKERVGEILIKSGHVDQEQLDSALAEQRRTMKKLGVILVERKLLTPQIFTQVFAFQVRETLLRIFQWGTGNYHFESTRVSWDQEFVSPLSAEYILMEAARIIDEWPAVRRKIPTGEAVFARTPGAEERVARVEPGKDEEDPFAEAGAQAYQDDKVPLSPAQARVFDHVDGLRTVEDLAYRTLLGEFEVCRALIELAAKGLVRPTRLPTTLARAEEAPVGKKKARPRLLTLVATLAGAAVFLAGLFYLSSLAGMGMLTTTRLTGDKARAFRAVVGKAQRDRLSFTLDVARLEQGSYPADLIDLAQGGYLSANDLSYPYGEPYIVRPNPVPSGHPEVTGSPE